MPDHSCNTIQLCNLYFPSSHAQHATQIFEQRIATSEAQHSEHRRALEARIAAVEEARQHAAAVRHVLPAPFYSGTTQAECSPSTSSRWHRCRTGGKAPTRATRAGTR